MVLFKHFLNRQHDFSGNKETYLKQDTFTSQKSKNTFWIDKKKKKSQPVYNFVLEAVQKEHFESTARF